jgi:hypothetical protein
MLLGGKIVFGGAAFTSACAIRDLSETGARIKMPSSEWVAEQIYLIEIRGAAVYKANVVWRRPPEYGLSFVAKYDVQALPSEIAYLRQLWVDSQVR